MKPDKEQWKDEVLNSLEGMQKAELSPFLFTRIQETIAQNHVKEETFFLSVKAMVTMVSLLLFVNIGVVIYTYQVTPQINMETEKYLIPTYNFYDYE